MRNRNRPRLIVDLGNKQYGDLGLVHQRQHILDWSVAGNGDRLACHDIHRPCGEHLIERAAQIAVGDDTDKRPGLIDNAGNALAAGRHFEHHVPHRCVCSHQWQGLLYVDDFLDRREPPADIATRMPFGDIGARQAPALHEEMGRIARASGFDEIIFVGPSYESVRRGYEAEAATGDAGSSSGSSESPVPMAAKRVFAPTYDAAIAKTLASHLGDGDYVLIKGSRGMSLEVFLEELSPIDFKKK